jgi:hypothetical protein
VREKERDGKREIKSKAAEFEKTGVDLFSESPSKRGIP